MVTPLPSRHLLKSAQQRAALQLFHDRHARALRDEVFEIDAHRDGDEIVTQLILKRHDRTSVYIMEATIVASQFPTLSEAEVISTCIDFLDWYLGEYFEADRDAYLPLNWKAIRFGELDVMARGEVRNALLDDAADAWLRGEHDAAHALLGKHPR